MKIFLALVFLMILLSAPVHAQRESRFFEAIYDIPVMPGLSEVSGQSLSFDKPDGRIAQSVAAAPGVAWKDVENFYDSSLPQLGWSRIAPGAYVRGGETLKIASDSSGEIPLVRFTLGPSNP